jgi:hypothetical protein
MFLQTNADATGGWWIFTPHPPTTRQVQCNEWPGPDELCNGSKAISTTAQVWKVKYCHLVRALKS